jgi:hypothetical protein
MAEAAVGFEPTNGVAPLPVLPAAAACAASAPSSRCGPSPGHAGLHDAVESDGRRLASLACPEESKTRRKPASTLVSAFAGWRTAIRRQSARRTSARGRRCGARGALRAASLGRCRRSVRGARGLPRHPSHQLDRLAQERSRKPGSAATLRGALRGGLKHGGMAGHRLGAFGPGRT